MAASPHRSNRRLVACVRIPELPIQAEMLRRPVLSGHPVVVASGGGIDSGPGTTVAYCSGRARAEGLHPGMPVREVLAACRGAIVLPPDPGLYEEIHDAVLDVLEDVAPVVEGGELGSAYTDITGMERLYPKTADLLKRLVDAAARARPGIKPAVGAGPGKFVAKVAAEEAGDEGCLHIRPEEAADFLSPLSVRYLPVSGEMHRRLDLLCLRTMGQIAAIDPVVVEAQFGAEGRLAHALSRGVDDEPVVARRPFRPIAETLVFPTPVSEWPPFWTGLRQLLVRIWQRRERRGATVRQVQILARIEEQTWEKTITLHEPVGDRNLLEAILRRRLADTDLPGAVSRLTLRFTLLGGPYVGQQTLFSGSSERLKRIKEAVAGIKARYGTTGLYRIAEVEPWSRIPERRYALIDFEP